MKKFIGLIVAVFQVFIYSSQVPCIYHSKLSRYSIPTSIESFEFFTFFDEVSGQMEIKEASLLNLKSNVKELHRIINFSNGFNYSVYYYFNTNNQLIKYVYSEEYNDYQNNKILDSTCTEIEYFNNNKVKSRFVKSIKMNGDSVLTEQFNHYFYNLNTGVIEKIIFKSINCELNFKSIKTNTNITLKKEYIQNCICNNYFPPENLVFSFDSLNNLIEVSNIYKNGKDLIQYEYVFCKETNLLNSIKCFSVNNPHGNYQVQNITYDSNCHFIGFNIDSRIIDQSRTDDTNFEYKTPKFQLMYNDFKDVIQLNYKINENEIIEKREFKYF
jgi:hypothetical protein